MVLVIDSNVLFTYFWESSVFREFCSHGLIMLSPEFALEEINKYKEEIMKKASISESQFNSYRQELVERVDFIALEDYEEELAQLTKQIVDEELLEDIDLLALAKKLDCPLWSNDVRLQDQSIVITLTTKNIIEVLDFKPI
ncbi:hypothetical protein JW968_02065 [Candidatus Woesearchaeota archaeon]|nr:hypothetical protein [Candidatus Woesearchaeota archaeon]